MTHGEQLFPDADVGPLSAQDPRAGDDPRIDDMVSARMGPFAFFRFVTDTRRSHRHDLGLLGGQAFPVVLGQQNLTAANRFGGLDGADETDPTHWYEVHAKENNT